MSSSHHAKSSDTLGKLYSKVASKILADSIHLKRGESITIETWNNGLPFAKKVVLESRRIGAIPLVVFEDEEAYLEGAKSTDKEMSGKMGKHEYGLLSGTDTYVFIPGPPLSMFHSGLSIQERSSSTAYNTSWYESAEKAKLRGVRLSTGYVGKDMAKVLGKPEDKIIEHQLKAIIEADFPSITLAGRKIAQELQDGALCKITSAEGSELEFQLQGDTEVEDGIVDETDVSGGYNMTYLPPGFISKRVNSSTVSGKVKEFSAATGFGLIRDATLEFESGNLVKSESKPSKKVLENILQSIKEESRNLGLFTIGLNPAAKLGYSIDRFVSGIVTLGIAFRLNVTLQKASVTVNGKQILASGKLVS